MAKLKKHIIPSMKRMMKAMCWSIYGAAVKILDLISDTEIGCSSISDGKPQIELSYEFEFVDKTTDPEMELVLYGVMTHELLHLLRTGFDYAAKRAESFPPEERMIRHVFANVVEDAAIEYLRSDKLSDFLNKALDTSINYFWRTGPALGLQDNALAELITAFIQFGDIGAVKGSFAFPEAEKAFIDCVPLFQKAIEEPSFVKRFEFSQEMFEICRALWQTEKDKADFLRKVMNAIRKAGKNVFQKGDGTNGMPTQDGKAASGENSKANERRKQTVHLVTKKQMDEIQKNDTSRDSSNNVGSGTPSDIYIADDDGSSADKHDDKNDLLNALSDDYEVVDERDDKSSQNHESAQNTNQDGSGIPAGSSTEDSNEGMKGSSGNDSEGKSDTPKESFDGNDSAGDSKDEQTNGNRQNSESSSSSKNDSSNRDSSYESSDLSDRHTEARGFEQEGKTEHGSGNVSSNAAAAASDGTVTIEDVKKNISVDTDKADKTTSCSVPDSTGNQTSQSADVSPAPKPEKQDLGEELKELSRQLTEELSNSGELELKNEAVQAVEEIAQMSENQEKREAALEAKRHSIENVDLTVSSPFYKNEDVKYTNIDVNQKDSCEYNSYLTNEETRRRVLNLKAGFKKAFRFKSGRKEYKTNGRLDFERYSGKKISARMFYRNTMPDDKADMAVVIFVDQSGSMGNGIARVRQTLFIILSALLDFDVKVKVVGFTTKYGGNVTYYHYGNKKWKNDQDLIECCMSMRACGGTFLGHALRYTGALLKNRPEQNKLYICITDGDPHCNIYKDISHGIVDCRNAVAEVRKWAKVIGIGLYDENDKDSIEYFKTIFKDGSVSMNDVNQLVRELPKQISKLLKD